MVFKVYAPMILTQLYLHFHHTMGCLGLEENDTSIPRSRLESHRRVVRVAIKTFGHSPSEKN